MTKLPASGTTYETPRRNEAELKETLRALGTGAAFDLGEIAELHSRIGCIVGAWLSEQSRVELEPVARALLNIANNLDEISRLLSGLQSGLHNDLEIAVTVEVEKHLALDPTIGSRSKARKSVSKFRDDASRLSHVCLIAFKALPNQAGTRGRRSHGWYDDFSALLLNIANTAGIKPSMRKDRISQIRSGWLLDAALALEAFLHPTMRSPSAEACGKRLERSLTALRKARRQK